MNREQAEKFRDKQIVHKYNLIHMVPMIRTPELSGLYLKSFYNASKRYQLRLPPSIEDTDTKFCASCGCVRIPSYNVEMSTAERGDSMPGESARELQYKCLHCNHVAKFPLGRLQENENITQKECSNPKFTATWPKKVRSEQDTTKVEKKNTAKERAKKRKMSSLSSLLSRKEEERKKKSSPSLSLDSFMYYDER